MPAMAAMKMMAFQPISFHTSVPMARPQYCLPSVSTVIGESIQPQLSRSSFTRPFTELNMVKHRPDTIIQEIKCGR